MPLLGIYTIENENFNFTKKRTITKMSLFQVCRNIFYIYLWEKIANNTYNVIYKLLFILPTRFYPDNISKYINVYLYHTIKLKDEFI